MSARSHPRERPLAPRSQRYDDASSRASSDFEDYQFSYPTDSRSTAQTSCRSWEPLKRVQKYREPEDIPPTVTQIDSTASPNSSAQSFSSVFDGSDSADEADEEEERLPAPTEDDIPKHLPRYRASIVDPAVRPSDPDSFERLFPSLDRLSIHHDDLTSDGNMNLRVDTVVPRSNGHRPITVQLFHLRMYDLARRNFALRRYCRDSGREVCNSKRAYAEPASASRPGFQRSMSTALHSFKKPFRRASCSSTGSAKRPSTGHSSNSSSWDNTSIRSMRRDSWSSDKPPPPATVLVPTNAIKLEFSNYARVDIERKGSAKSLRYEFEWWGHTYLWKLVHDKDLDTVSFHLHRSGRSQPVAHITPESRSPNQVEDDEYAGGWIPPYHMWICDESVLNAQVDVADVIIATGLIALVDDCIKTRWQNKKVRQPIKSGSHEHLQGDNPLRPFRGFWNRRYSEQPSTKSIRTSRPVAAY